MIYPCDEVDRPNCPGSVCPTLSLQRLEAFSSSEACQQDQAHHRSHPNHFPSIWCLLLRDMWWYVLDCVPLLSSYVPVLHCTFSMFTRWSSKCETEHCPNGPPFQMEVSMTRISFYKCSFPLAEETLFFLSSTCHQNEECSLTFNVLLTWASHMHRFRQKMHYRSL